MLARRSKIYLKSEVVAETPLLLPSFSSKGFAEVREIMNVMGEFITGGVLVSAYDIHYEMISARALKFAETVFLDSGGYEARIDHDLSETYGRPYKPKSWTQLRYREVLNEWKLPKPTIVVSFDSPKKYLRAKQQIKEALRLRDRYPDLLFELILKPDTKHSTIVPMERLIKQVKELRSFAAVGFSEKELDIDGENEKDCSTAPGDG